MARLSILGMYEYDPEIFKGFRVPGVADITDDAEKEIRWVPDRQVALDYILTSCGELSLVYTDPVYLRYAIRSWTARRFPVWAALYNSTLYKYNPIWNVDGVETTTRDLTETDDETTSGSGTTTGGKTTTDTMIDDEDTTGNVSSSGTTDADLRGNVTAYDTNAYSPNDQQIQDIDTSSQAQHSGTRDLTRTQNGSETTTGTSQESGSRDRDRTEKETLEHVRHGNIGVTMTQQMIEAERNAVMFSLYDVIMQDFKSEFCVMVY